jgi:predicted lysophospholipase L1 biosynthesis ABC-type transport system permease subunit
MFALTNVALMERFMKLLTLLGILLIVLGGLALAYQGFTYVSRDTIAEVGPIKVQANRERTVPLPPILGGVALAVGVGLMIVGLRQNRPSSV